ncbi:hypothetical protein OKW24_000186 [Peribacillus simplex]|nr:hypothetical protein [Peribacillus simplex]
MSANRQAAAIMKVPAKLLYSTIGKIVRVVLLLQ